MSERITEFEREGLVFDVRDEGPLDGEPIVLLHGFPERATSWREVATLLHAEGYRTLAVDQRGYSPRARPKRRRDYVVPELVADVAALIDLLPDGSAHVVGHDWGAIVAWSIAIEHPEKVRTLTAVSVGHPAAFVKSFVHSGQLLKSWYMGLFQLPLVPERLTSSRTLGRRWLLSAGKTPEEVEQFQREMVEDGALSTALNWYRALPLSDPRTTRRKVTVPTTLVWSDDDVALGPWAPHHTEKWVDAPFCLVVLHDVTHWIPTQAPEELAQAVLDRVSGRAIGG
ncbi:MAG TPA: alpha/beta fold hydrolase [Nocardioides sp.]|nr:alpha/beta fold hydrolase [Nocardioides sp.]